MTSTDNILLDHLWTDYSSGQTFKTYTGSKSAAIQAALPIFGSFVGSQTWPIVRLTIWHLYYRRQGRRPLCWRPSRACFEGCLEQQMLLIRNADGGFDLTKGLFKHWLCWTRWYKAKHAAYHTCFPIITIMVCLTHFAGWIAAGVMIGQIWASSPTDQALLRGTCGSVVLNDSHNSTQDFIWRALNNNYTATADEYARQCYVTNVAPTASCSYYTQRMISIQDGNATCPFASSNICLEGSIPYYVDSQLIDSSTVLGINAPEKDRVAFRKRSTCSPVTSQGRVEIIYYNQTTDNQIWPNETKLYRFFYGTINGSNFNDSFTSNWTYEFSDDQPDYALQYGVTAVPYFGASGGNIWTPNATFWDPSREDADVALMFVNGNHVVYEYQTDDPIFATGESYFEVSDNVTTEIWTPEYYTNVLACIDQYQICNSSSISSSCTPLVSAYRLAEEIFDLGLSDVQMETAKRLIALYPALGTYYTIAGRGAAAFQATLGLADTLQTLRLPDDQWRIEVKAWFAISLAKLQQLVVQYAAVPDDPIIRESVNPPVNPIASAQCLSQRISLPAGATNFNWNGVLILISLGIFIWTIGVTAEWIVDKFLGCIGAEDRRLTWNATGPTGLQRLVYLTAGYNEVEWDQEESEMPVWLPGMNATTSMAIIDHALRLSKSQLIRTQNQSSIQLGPLATPAQVPAVTSQNTQVPAASSPNILTPASNAPSPPVPTASVSSTPTPVATLPVTNAATSAATLQNAPVAAVTSQNVPVST